MPRTKISKCSKRNRDAALAEHVREMELLTERDLNQIEFQGTISISEIEAAFKGLIDRTNNAVLDLFFVEFRKLDLKRFSDYIDIVKKSSSDLNQQQYSTKTTSGNDDGYITEDSGSSNSALAAYLSSTQRGRTPGPLCSAQALRNRRSRSACTDTLTHSVLSHKKNVASTSVSSSGHASRNKMRTPMAARPKAVSADRSAVKQNTSVQPKSPPAAFLRWPKPGEWLLSVHGSPLVAQVMPDRFANVNIPIKNGVISLRPKKLNELASDIADNIDIETFNQIKTLTENLDKILSMATKKNLENN